MPSAKVTFDTARRIGLALPGVEEGTMYGTPALKLHGRLLVCIPTNKAAEPASLAVRTDFETREALLTEDPVTYYLREHYRSHPIVLVRTSKIGADQLAGLLRAAWHIITTDQKKKGAAKRSKTKNP